MDAEMAVLMFLGIMRTMMSRRPRTVKATKTTPEMRVMTMAEPKDMVPPWIMAPSRKLVPMPVERAKGMLA